MAVGQRQGWWVRMETYAPYLLFLAAYGFLLRAINPSFYLDDSPETITASVLVGIPHPPGYPLHTLLGHWATFIPVSIAPLRVNLLAAILAGLTAVCLVKLLKKYFDLFAPAAYAVGFLWVAGTTSFPSALGAKGSVYQLTALLLVLLLDALLSRKLCLAAFLWGLSMGHHWMTMAAFTPGLLWLAYVYREDRDWTPRSVWRFAAFALLGGSTVLVLPIRAMADPALNWGDPKTLSNFLFNFRRAQYVGADLGFNPLVWARQGWVFLKTAFLEFPGLSLLAVAGAWLGWRQNRKLTVGLLGIWGGMGLSICLYLNLGMERDYLITVYALPTQLLVLVLAGWALASLMRLRAEKGFATKKFTVLFLVLLAVTMAGLQFSKSRRDRYFFDYDYALDTMKGVTKGSLLYCRGDGLVFPSWYFQQVEKKRLDLVAVGVDGLPMEWVRRHLAAEHPGLKVPMPTWNVGNESIPTLARSIAVENRDRELFLSYNRVTDGSFPETKILPCGLSSRAVLPPEEASFDESKAKYLWAVMRLRGRDGPVDSFTSENLLKDYAIQRNSLGVYYEDLADRMKEGIPGQKPATAEDFQRVYGACLESFQWARDYFPTDWEFPFNVGNALYNLGRKPEAALEYRKASELNPEAVDVFFNWSVAVFESKDYFEASRLFQKVLEMDPNRQGAKDGLDYLKKIGFLKSPTPTQP